MSLTFSLDPPEGEEGVQPLISSTTSKAADVTLGQPRRLSGGRGGGSSARDSGVGGLSNENEDSDEDKGQPGKQRQHGNKRSLADRRRVTAPLGPSEGGSTTRDPPQTGTVRMVMPTPPASPGAKDSRLTGTLSRTSGSSKPQLVRMYTGKQKSKRSSALLFLDDLKRRVFDDAGALRSFTGLQGNNTPSDNPAGRTDFWKQAAAGEEANAVGGGGSGKALSSRMPSSTSLKDVGRTRRKSQVAALMDDVDASLNGRKSKVIETNVTQRPSKVGHLDEHPLETPTTVSPVTAGTGEVRTLFTAKPIGSEPTAAAPMPVRRMSRQERRRSMRRKSMQDGIDMAGTSGGRRRSSARRRSSGSSAQDTLKGTAIVVPAALPDTQLSTSFVETDDDGSKEDEAKADLIFTLEEWIDDRNPGLGRQVVEEEWSVNHAKLLYLISKFAVCARTADDQESWIRSLPLIILLYEGIVAGCLDFDYAPASTLVSMDGRSRRVWLNTTQEGKAAVDDLREGKMINGLKLSTVDFQPVTAYQVSLRGLKALEQVPDRLKAMVDDFVHTPKDDRNLEHELLQVRYKTLEELAELKPFMEKYNTCKDEEEIEDNSDTEGYFVLMGENSKYIRRSSITSSEDVSYVSSPYLPTCIRNVRRMKRLTSNKHRSHESAVGSSNIRDNLNEAIILSNVHAIVGEWIPFGANQIVALNERLGSVDRCQGGMFSSLIDKYPCELSFESEPGLTQVKILDYDPVRFINFEAEIHFPEADGIVQVENFGIHINVDGSVMYGIYVEAIMHRKDDDISLDLLSRMLVDVHQDSSSIMNDLLSKYQKSLMDMIFMGDMDHRAKFNMIIADGIEPFLYCEEYMDREDNENELKQVIGDLYNVFDVGEHAVLMLGRDGMIFAGSSASSFEQVLVSYLNMLVREMFIRVFFIRTFVLDDLLKQTRQLVVTYESNPNNIAEIRTRLNDASRDIIILEALLEYLKESLENLKVPPPPKDKDGAALFRSLDIEARQKDVMHRVIDLRKLVHGARSEMHILQKMRDVINSKKLEDVYKDVEGNTKYLVDASAANERASASLEVMQVILGGTLGFSIIDRLAGGTMNMEQPDWVVNYVVAYIIDVPYLWFVVNMLWFLVVSVCLFKFMRYLGQKSEGALTIRRKVNRRIRLAKLQAYLATKKLAVLDALQDSKTRVKKASWEETDEGLWKGEPPKVDVQYDERYGFMLAVVLRVNARNTTLKEHQLMSKFLAIMQEQGVLLTPQEEEEEEAAAVADDG